MKKIETGNGSRNLEYNFDSSLELGIKIDRLNRNLESQIRIWSWRAVLLRAMLNTVGYILGLAILIALLAFVLSRFTGLPLIGAVIKNVDSLIHK